MIFIRQTDVKKIDRYCLLGLKLSVSQMSYEEDMRTVCLSSRDFLYIWTFKNTSRLFIRQFFARDDIYISKMKSK
jgi:hypothetical protein